MEAREKVMVKAGQIVEVLKDCNKAEMLTIITSVLAELNQSMIPVLILGEMARSMGNNQVVINEDKGGWHVVFDYEPYNDDADNGADEYEQAPEGADFEAIEKESIIKALNRNDYNSKRTAQDLRISERSLYRKMEKYGIKS